jgi:hypothetical protein
VGLRQWTHSEWELGGLFHKQHEKES